MIKSKVWQLADWRKRRQEFIKAKECKQCGSKKNLVIHHPQKRNALANEEYYSFEGTIILCRKCHFLFHIKHVILCQTCKEKYHSTRFRECFQCHEKGEVDLAKELKELEEQDKEEDEFFLILEQKLSE